ncbi:MAG: hypothetical protein WCO71_00425 [Pseudomonadota bacterium]
MPGLGWQWKPAARGMGSGKPMTGSGVFRGTIGGKDSGKPLEKILGTTGVVADARGVLEAVRGRGRETIIAELKWSKST